MNRYSPADTLQPHGTVGAARRHQRAAERLCSACAEAWRDHQHRMYEQRKGPTMTTNLQDTNGQRHPDTDCHHTFEAEDQDECLECGEIVCIYCGRIVDLNDHGYWHRDGSECFLHGGEPLQ